MKILVNQVLGEKVFQAKKAKLTEKTVFTMFKEGKVRAGKDVTGRRIFYVGKKLNFEKLETFNYKCSYFY